MITGIVRMIVTKQLAGNTGSPFMFEILGERYIGALQISVEAKLGPQHPCARAIARVAESGNKSDIDAAHQHLSALPPELLGALMETVHKAMREDPDALLNIWNRPDDVRRPN